MALSELVAIVPPPVIPSDVPKSPNWTDVESKLGLPLPSDFKEYVTNYGSGLLGKFIVVANPFSSMEGVELFSVIKMIGDTLRISNQRQGIAYEVYPSVPGLLPFGGDENGNNLCWLTEGTPDEWPCIVGAGRDDRWERFDMPMTTFLAKALSGDVICTIWPDVFSKRRDRRTFDPY
jgi:hypothetical protein